MAELLVSTVLEQLLSFGFEQAEQEVRLLLGVDDEINCLQTTFNILKGLLEDAEEKQSISNGVKAWLEDVKDITYCTDDVLDEWRTKLLQGSITTENSIDTKKNKQVLSCLSCSFFCFKQVVVRHDIGHRIKDIKRRLDENVRHIDQLKLVPREPSHHQENPHLQRRTTSLVDVSDILGRDGDKDAIMKWLLNDINQQQPPQVHAPDVASIVGTGGFGKTTLAQLVFNQENVMTAFDSRVWVCVSEHVDIQRITKEIIELITKEKPKVDGLEALLQCLCESIKGKYFLLILDDVWPNSLKPWWDQLKNPLRRGASGSKIMVTTRSQEVATMMCSSNTHNLEQLSEENCWLLFKQVAFSTLPHKLHQFERVGKDIAKKCKGVPLATKTIASLMQFKQTMHDWQNVLDSNVWEYVSKDLSPALLLSYNDLSPQLKQCFMYCAVIPKDTVMRKERLVKLWMAQGFISSDGGQELEMIGEEYFNGLAMRSFFQDFQKYDSRSVSSCKMHDLVHDFAQSLTKTECCVIQTNRETCSSKVRHLTVHDIENPNISKVKKNLRTLIVSSLVDSTDISKWFCELTCLRTLDLSHSRLRELPKEVELLLHIRYLDVSETKLTELPESLCKLCNLQTLKLNDCYDLCKLPDGIGELSNLRHLEIDSTFRLNYFPKGIEKLSCLRTLNKFVVSGERGGCRIGELGNLNDLGGLLLIEGLWQVDNMTEAKHARLQEKKNLDTLFLNFHGPTEDSEKMEGVLKGLQLPNTLKDLRILYYPGLTVSVETTKPDLRILFLVSCPNIKALPAPSELQFLESLEISGVDKMKHVSAELFKISGSGINEDSSSSSSPTSLVLFPNLKSLSLKEFPEWEEEDEKIEEETTNKTIMPCLLSLYIYECPKLKMVPRYMFSQTLQELRISWCPGLNGMQPCLPPLLEKMTLRGDVGVLKTSLLPIIHNNNNSYPHLKCVTIGRSQISLLPQGLTQFMSLQRLELRYCKFLDFKPEEVFRHLHTLTTLTIYIDDCPLLKERSSRENWSNLSNFPKIIFW